MTRSTGSARTRLALTALAAALPLALAAGCSGDDDNPPAPDAQQSDGGEQVVGCTATVDATGDAETSWEGKAVVNLRNDGDEGSGPAARYTTESGDGATLSVFSAGPDFDPNITLSLEGVAYSGGSDPEGLDAAEDGSEATADVELTGPRQATVQLEATITCDDPEADE